MSGTAQGDLANDLSFIAETRQQVQDLFNAFQAGRLTVNTELTTALTHVREQMLAIKLDGSVHPEAADQRIMACTQIRKMLPNTPTPPTRADVATGPVQQTRSLPSVEANSAEWPPPTPGSAPVASWPATYLDGTPPSPPPVPAGLSLSPEGVSPDDVSPTAHWPAEAPGNGYLRIGQPIFDTQLPEPIPPSQAGRSVLFGLAGLFLPIFSLFGLAYGIRSYRRVRKHPGAGSRGMAISGILVSLITPALAAFALYAYLNPSHHLNMSSVRRVVANQTQSEFMSSSHDNPVVHVNCPASEYQRQGITFDCTATATGGINRTVQVQIREADNSGDFSITIVSVRP